MTKSSLLIALSGLLVLGACSTSVITDEDRALPDSLEPAAMEDGALEPIIPDTLAVKVADRAQSFIAFTGEKPGIVKHEGKFNDFDVILSLEKNLPVAIDVIIEIGSIETDSEGLTKHLLSADFFDAETFPVATFSSTAIEAGDNENQFTVTGDLELHGVMQEITFAAVITDAYLTMNTILDRTVFSVGGTTEGFTGIAKDVPIEAKIVLVEEE